MKKFLLMLSRTFLSIGFLEYCALGLVNTFNVAVFSSLAGFIMQENVAAIAGYICANIIAFVLDCLIIFKKKPTIRRYARFAVSYIPSFIFYITGSVFTLNLLELPQFWGTVLAAMIGGPITFIIVKLYTFKQDI